MRTGLVTQLYRPKRVRFSHSSLAEVFFYVLVDMEMEEGVPNNWNERIKQVLIRYFEYLSVERQLQVDSFLLNLFSSQLFFPDFDIDRIITEFVGCSEFKTLLTSEPLAVQVYTLRRLVAKASLGRSEAIKAINDAICRQVKYLCGKTEAWNEEERIDFSTGIFGLSKSSLDHLRSLELQLTVEQIITKIRQGCYILDLFNLLQNSSPSRAGALIGALESSDIDALVDKTVKQERSIETLHYTFNGLRGYRSLLEELLKVLSPPLLARLIIRAGTLNSLMLISSQLPKKYLIKLRLTISQYPHDAWQELVFRGLPSNLVNFLSRDIQHYPDAVRNLLDNIVANEGTRFLKKSSWYELNAANYDSDEPITTILREQLEHLLASTPADALLGFDFKETTNAISIMWRHATPQHAFLNARLWELLPPQPQWPKDYGLGFLSNVIQHLCHKDFNRQNAKKLLCKASDHALQVNWTKAAPSLLFSFLWQLWQASYHLSVSDPSQYFPQSLSDNAIDLLKKLLSKKKYRNSDKIALYALAGLLLFIRPEKERELRGIVKGRLTGLYYLRDEIRTALANNGLGFVAGYFALYGMGLVCDPSHNFTIGLRMALKARFREYPHTTQAVDTLFSDVEKIR